MSNYLENKGRIIISAAATPTQAEIDSQFAPQTMRPSVDSLATEDSGRSDDGIMHIYYVLDRIRKLEITLKPDTVENVSKILSKVVGRFYYITF